METRVCRTYKKIVLGALLVPLLMVWPAMAAASLGGVELTSYRDLHGQTEYGALFLNVGQFNTAGSRSHRRFREVVGSGEFASLPSQRGFCFAFNHFGSEAAAGSWRTYAAKTIKTKMDGSTYEENFSGRYQITSEIVARDLPDFCISGLNDVAKLEIQFSGEDGGGFNRTISFKIEPW